jgi:tetratricopeptide (TPR) repeat protein
MAKAQRAPIAVALIAKDSEKTLPVCLKSIRPYVQQIVVGVDTNTTDKTAKAARKAGADVVFPVQVSDWHECEAHGRVLAQHFARARNESFARLDPSIPWKLWLDADDFVRGAEHLADGVASIPDDVVGAWLEYAYATMNNYRAVNTSFDRERILRSSVGWEWRHRVHEVVVPRIAGTPRWTRLDSVVVVHQEGVHKTESSTARNELLLEIDLEEDPDSTRTIFYMANGLFAQQRWDEAAAWYERLCAIGGANPYETWQSYVYASMAYQRLGASEDARRCAYSAIDTVPEHPEPYWRLAALALESGEHERALYWTREAQTGGKTDPPFFVFKNPLDGQYNARMVAADALTALGHVGQARRHYEAAHAVLPTEATSKAIAHCAGIEAAAAKAQAFVDLYRDQGAETIARVYGELPYEVRAFGRVRDLAVPALRALRGAA